MGMTVTGEKYRCEREEETKDYLESLLEEKSLNQIRSDYRCSLGNEYSRRYMK
jgi:hypothetical protein